MRQYEFEAIHRTRGNVERIRAAASRADYARAHIVAEAFQISNHYSVPTAHKI